MIHLLRGRANTGKSRAVLARMAKNGALRPQILLVPDHASFAAEVDLCRACGPTARRLGEVLAFRRLAQRGPGAGGSWKSPAWALRRSRLSRRRWCLSGAGGSG